LNQVEALDHTCAMGSITFHIHGERAPTAGEVDAVDISRSVRMFVSSSIAAMSSIRPALQAMEDMFTRDVAVAYTHEWAARASYPESTELLPPSSSIRATPNDGFSASRLHVARDGHAANPSSSITAFPHQEAVTHPPNSNAHALSSSTPSTLASALPESSVSGIHSVPSSSSTPEVYPRITFLSNEIVGLLKGLHKNNQANRVLVEAIFLGTRRASWSEDLATSLDISLGVATALATLMDELNT
jgi:hypothetical protein